MNMNIKILARLITITTLGALSACSTIKEAFPDKEKDYQFTTEIPKLVIPNDLGSSKALSPSTSSATRTESASATATEKTEATATTEASENKSAENTTADEQPEIEPKSITVDLLESSNKIGYLRINTPFLRAWRMVSKGLSRQAIEVTERNQTDKIFTVQYDPDEKTVEDGSYEDEINFILHGFQSNETEYLLKLVETNQQTDVVVLNSEQKPTSDAAALKLLKILQKSIKANLAGK